MKTYDAIIIGSGQAGNPLARYLSSKGLKIALIEKDQIGGTCVNYGCTPTKTLVSSAKIAHLNRRAGDYGIITSPISIDFKKVMERMREVVLGSRSSNERSFDTNPLIDLFHGEARFIGKNEIRVHLNTGEILDIHSKKIFINSGARPRVPKIEGLENIPYITSNTVFDLNILPDQLIILGGSYIALEFAQIFARLGSKVTVLSQDSVFLPKEDEEFSSLIKTILEEEGIEFKMGALTQKVYSEGGQILAEYEQNDLKGLVKGSHIFLAVGRTPNSDLDLDIPGVEMDKYGSIKTNEFLETNIPGIYALGDIKGGPAFTHISYDDYRIIRDNWENPGSHSTLGRLTNYTLFIDPELGRIGMNEKEAKQKGIAYSVGYLPMQYVARAIEMGETKGMMKVIMDPDKETILGASILGVQGGEVSASIQLAIEGGLKAKDLNNFIFAHPTLLESLNNLFANIK